MNIILIISTLVIWLVTLVYLYLKWRHSYWKRIGVAELEPEFLFGDMKGMIKEDMSIAETFFNFYKLFKQLDVKCGGVYMMFTPGFVPIDPGLIKDILQKNFEYFNSHLVQTGKPTISTKGLFNLEGENGASDEGEPWRQTRKKLTPTFTSGKMKMMFETLLEKTTGLGELAGEMAESGEAVNIKEVLGRFTTDVIGSCGFGIECNALKNPDSDFVKFGRMFFDPPEKTNIYWTVLRRLIVGRRPMKNLIPVENFFKQMVSDTIDYREKTNLYRKDFMHLMIQLKNKGVITDDEQIFDKSGGPKDANTFDIDEITAQCLLFFIAGYETSATTMTFALLELAQNQDIQEKVREESNAIIKKHNGTINYDAMLELTYTEKVINETLRKYPPLATLPRVCTKDYIVPGTNAVIKKGTPTFIPVWGLHMDPEYFPDPDKFDPERFSEENKKFIKDFTYMPFGEGPRMCLGLRFGMMQSKIGLISLVRNYNFTLHKNTTFPLKMERNTVITTVSGDVWLNIQKV